MVDATETPTEEVEAVEVETPATETHDEPAPATETPTEEVEAPAAVEPDPAPLATDRVRVKHPDGIGVNFAGHQFDPDKDGVVSVPAFAVVELRAHGFEPVQA